MTLRRLLVVVLAGVSTLAILGMSALVLFSGRSALGDEVAEQLAAVRHDRADAITRGVDRALGRVVALASDPAVVDAAVGFSSGTEELDRLGDDALDGEQASELFEFVEEVVQSPATRAALAPFDLDPPSVDEVIPDSPAGRYLQYHYVVRPGHDRSARIEVVDPGDGSSYTETHAAFHPRLASLVDGQTIQDVMIVSPDGRRVLYTASKGLDLGSDPTSGALAADGLGRALNQTLLQVPPGEAIAVDFEPYIAAGGAPTMFAAAAIRDESEVVGTLVVQVPVELLNGLMTADGAWSSVGLGNTGEAYVVGRDLLMRSDARGWIEDPEAFLAAVDPDPPTAEAIEATGSTVLLQAVDTAPVRAALEGRSFAGRARNVAGRSTIADAAPLPLPGLDWVIVAEVEADEALGVVARLVRRSLLAALILVPAVGVLGWWLARKLARPLGPVAAAAGSIADGDLTARVNDASSDEVGHLARQLDGFAELLAAEEAQLAAHVAESEQLLLAALPPRLVDPVRRGQVELGDLLDTATVVVLTTEPVDGHELPAEVSAQVTAEMEQIASRSGLERVWASSDRHLFLAGLGDPESAREEDAAGFVLEVCARLDVLLDKDEVAVHAALSSGLVATGVVGGDHVSLGVWGRPVRAALALDAHGGAGQILVDNVAAEHLGSGWSFSPERVTAHVEAEQVVGVPLLGRRDADAMSSRPA